MRTQPSYPQLSIRRPLKGWPILLALLATLITLLSSSCDPADITSVDLPLTATLTVDFSDPNTRTGCTGGYTYEYEGQVYPATYKAWSNFDCSGTPRFFASYNDVNQTVWLAHCVEGIHIGTVQITTNAGNTNPAPFLTEITGGHVETIEFQIPGPNLNDIQNGTTQLTISFSYQND